MREIKTSVDNEKEAEGRDSSCRHNFSVGNGSEQSVFCNALIVFVCLDCESFLGFKQLVGFETVKTIAEMIFCRLPGRKYARALVYGELPYPLSCLILQRAQFFLTLAVASSATSCDATHSLACGYGAL